MFRKTGQFCPRILCPAKMDSQPNKAINSLFILICSF